jgi:hypothetical protein
LRERDNPYPKALKRHAKGKKKKKREDGLVEI